MRLDEQLDHGPVLATHETEIGPGEDAGALGARLALMGAELLVDVLARLDDLQAVEQDHAAATQAPKLSREDGELEWSLAADEIDRRVRALHPWPGVTLPLGGGRVKVLRGRPLTGSGRPGEVLAAGHDGVEVAAGDGSYLLQEVQPPGRRPMAPRTLVTSRA